MKLQEGPLFGAIIIGGGIGFFIYQKTQNLSLSLAAGAGIIIADYALVVLIKSFYGKKK